MINSICTKIKKSINSEKSKNECIFPDDSFEEASKMKESDLTSKASVGCRNPDFDTSFHTSNDDNEASVHTVKGRTSPLLPSISKEQHMPDSSLRYNLHLKYEIRSNNTTTVFP